MKGKVRQYLILIIVVIIIVLFLKIYLVRRCNNHEIYTFFIQDKGLIAGSDYKDWTNWGPNKMRIVDDYILIALTGSIRINDDPEPIIIWEYLDYGWNLTAVDSTNISDIWNYSAEHLKPEIWGERLVIENSTVFIKFYEGDEFRNRRNGFCRSVYKIMEITDSYVKIDLNYGCEGHNTKCFYKISR